MIAPPQPNIAKPSDNFGVQFVVCSLTILLVSNLTNTLEHLQVLKKYYWQYGQVHRYFYAMCDTAFTPLLAPRKKAQKISLNEFLGDNGKYLVQTVQKKF